MFIFQGLSTFCTCFSSCDLHWLFLWLGGAGGKGVWGAAGMVYEVEEPDAKDPNYDESSQVSVYLHNSLTGYMKNTSTPHFMVDIVV